MLDLFPSCKEEKPPNPALTVRLHKLRETLTTIEISVRNRELLISLARKDPQYRLHLLENKQWKAWAEGQNRLYYAVLKQMTLLGDRAKQKHVEDWEAKVEELRQGTLHLSDVIVGENMAWNASWLAERPAGLKKGWNFGEAERRGGPGLEEDQVAAPTDTGMMNPNGDVGRKYAKNYAGIAKNRQF